MVETAGPTAAERARTVLARAASAQVTWLDPGGAAESRRTRPASRFRLDEATRGALASARRATVEVAEAAGLPVRERILTVVRVMGPATPDGHDPTLLWLRPSAVQVEASGTVTEVDLADFHRAEPDPLADSEATLLCHLDSMHADLVETLTSLVHPPHLQGVVRVWPLQLDQYGLVLRLDYARGHRDVRLAFATPAPTLDETRSRVHALADEATRRRHACRARGLRPR